MYLQTRDVVTTLEVAGIGRGAIGSSSHSVTVVLANKDSREIPEFSHVVGLKDLTLVRGTVTIEGKGGSVMTKIFLGKGNTSTQGNLGANNTVTAKEVWGKHVHGTTFACRDTGLASKKLGQDGGNGGATHVGETVATVGSDDLVLLSQRGLHTDGNGFLLSHKVQLTNRKSTGESGCPVFSRFATIVIKPRHALIAQDRSRQGCRQGPCHPLGNEPTHPQPFPVLSVQEPRQKLISPLQDATLVRAFVHGGRAEESHPYLTTTNSHAIFN